MRKHIKNKTPCFCKGFYQFSVVPRELQKRKYKGLSKA